MIPDRPSVSIASDERARIPFAIIGVLLLLSSVAIVTALETRPEPESNIDPSLSLDRAEASTQAAMKDAMLDASQDAAASPVTEAAGGEDDDDDGHDEAEFEGLLGSADTDDLGSRDEADEVFRNYVALLVYKEVYSRANGTTHTIRENATTTVAIDPIEDEDDAEEAMSDVTFRVGSNPDHPAIEPGTVQVTLKDVDFVVRQEGDLVTNRRKEINVTVATPLFDLHKKTQTYQERLRMSMFNGGSGFTGIGREWAARNYPIVIAKSTYNYINGRPRRKSVPFKRVVPTKQTEVLVNHANYGVQSKVFGTRDPDWKLPMVANFLCWINYEYEVNLRGTPDLAGLLPDPGVIPGEPKESSSSEPLCERLKRYYETASDALDAAPGVWDIVTGETVGEGSMQQEENVTYQLFARQAYTDLVVEGKSDVIYSRTENIEENHSDVDQVDMDDQRTQDYSIYHVEDIVENVYSVDVRVEQVSSTDASLSTDPRQPDGYSRDGSADITTSDGEEEIQIQHHWESLDSPGTEPHLFTVTIRDEIEQFESQRWEKETEDGTLHTRTNDDDSDWATVRFEIYGEYAPGSTIDTPTRRPALDPFNFIPVHSGTVDDPFKPPNGGSSDPPANFDTAPESTLRQVFGASGTSMDSIKTALKNQLDGVKNRHGAEIASTFDDPEDRDVVLGPSQVTSTDTEELQDTVDDALAVGRDKVIEQGPLTFERTEFVSRNPHQEAYDRLTNRQAEIVHDGDVADPFGAMPAFLRAEARHRLYWNALLYTSIAAANHDTQVGEVAGDGDEGNLGDALELAEEATGRDRPAYGGTIESSDLLGTVSFQIQGSPTYLEFDEIERDDDIPSLRPEESMAHELAGANEVEFVPGSGCYDNRVRYFGVPILPIPGSWYVTASSWNADFHGEYSRFEVTANVSEPSRAPSLSYVREAKDVPMEIGGETAIIGEVKPIEVDTWGEFPMIVPPGKGGVGDSNTKDGSEDASKEWDYHGPDWDEVEDDDTYPKAC